MTRCSSQSSEIATTTPKGSPGSTTKIDLLLEHAGLTYEPFKGVPEAVVEALKDGRKILAIKRYREATGTGLKEAKDFIDSLERDAV